VGLEGIVIKSTGSWYTVRQEDKSSIQCKLKGSFRIKGIKTTSPVAVGDRVRYDVMPEKGIGLINHIYERDNYIIRKSKKLSKISHIIASNIDQAILIITLIEPRTSTGFIDRFLVTAEAYHIPACLVFNKIDLYDETHWQLHNEIKRVYSSVGYPCIEVSAIRGDNLDDLIMIMKNKSSLLSGHSGVGKSALINAIQPDLKLKTGDLSPYHRKGMHTTTFAEMFELTFGGFIIDTPGIKEFGLIDFNQQEVSERFPEMRALMHQCQFHNCTHVHEPNCEVKRAVEEGKIDAGRYKSYLGIYHGDWEEDYTS